MGAVAIGAVAIGRLSIGKLRLRDAQIDRLRIGSIELGDPALPLIRRPHLVFFLHDELVVHTPEALAPAVEAALREAAVEAGRMLFGSAPVEFALTVATVESYADAK